MSTANKNDRPISERQAEAWKMPENGVCGIGAEFAERSWIEISLGMHIGDDCDLFFEDDDFGYGIDAGEKFLRRLY
jgi:hypothetical protein